MTFLLFFLSNSSPISSNLVALVLAVKVVRDHLDLKVLGTLHGTLLVIGCVDNCEGVVGPAILTRPAVRAQKRAGNKSLTV